MTVSWIGAAIVIAWVAAYVAYTLGELTRLQKPLLHLRRPGVAAGLGLALVGMVLEIGMCSSVRFHHFVPLVLAVTAAAYAWRRQWLLPRHAPVLVAAEGTMELSTQELVAVLAGGAAVPLRLLAHLRTARVADRLVVHCALARSLTVFDSPVDPVAAVLPHATGFFVGSKGRLWDGVDGSAHDRGPPLRRCPVGLSTYASWRQTFPEGALYLQGLGRSLPNHPLLFPVSAERSAPGAMDWGTVEHGVWVPAALDLCPDPAAAGDRYYLARWAAKRRGMAPR
jgi:hypothetical protein